MLELVRRILNGTINKLKELRNKMVRMGQKMGHLRREMKTVKKTKWTLQNRKTPGKNLKQTNVVNSN
jgi:hypothetical protein